MSVQSDLKKAGIKLTAAQKRQIRVKVFNLKNTRKRLEFEMKSIVEHARKEGREAKKGELTKLEKRLIAKKMEERALISRQVFRFGGERKTPDFDPY